MSMHTPQIGYRIWPQAILFAAYFIGSLMFAGSAARAQVGAEEVFARDQFRSEVPRGETVRSRQRPEVDPVGIRAGAFMIRPSLSQGIEYNDNVFATEDNEKSDVIYTIGPRVDIRSNWTRHNLALAAGGNIGFYFDESDENYQDFFARGLGTFEITSRNALRGNVGFRRSHEARTSPNDVGGVEPTLFYVYDAGLQFIQRFNRLSFLVSGDAERRDYEDADLAGGGVVNNDDRDRVTLRPGLRAAYEFLDGYEIFVRGEGFITQYDDSVDDAGFDRDVNGFDVVGGFSIDLTGLVFGDVFAGYRERYFDDTAFDTVRGHVVGAALTWTPTPLTTVILRVDNQVTEANNSTASSITSTGVGLNVDHELLRNLILGAAFGFRLDDFEGSPEEEKGYQAGVSADYLMNRYMRLRARYTFRYTDNNQPNKDFTQNAVFGSLILSL